MYAGQRPLICFWGRQMRPRPRRRPCLLACASWRTAHGAEHLTAVAAASWRGRPRPRRGGAESGPLPPKAWRACRRQPAAAVFSPPLACPAAMQKAAQGGAPAPTGGVGTHPARGHAKKVLARGRKPCGRRARRLPRSKGGGPAASRASQGCAAATAPAPAPAPDWYPSVYRRPLPSLLPAVTPSSPHVTFSPPHPRKSGSITSRTTWPGTRGPDARQRGGRQRAGRGRVAPPAGQGALRTTQGRRDLVRGWEAGWAGPGRPTHEFPCPREGRAGTPHRSWPRRSACARAGAGKGRTVRHAPFRLQQRGRCTRACALVLPAATSVPPPNALAGAQHTCHWAPGPSSDGANFDHDARTSAHTALLFRASLPPLPPPPQKPKNIPIPGSQRAPPLLIPGA